MPDVLQVLKTIADGIYAALTQTEPTPPAALAVDKPPKTAATERTLSIQQIYGQLAQALYEQIPNAWINDLYAADDGALFAILSIEGKLYKVAFAVAGTAITVGPLVEVEIDFKELPFATGGMGRTNIIRQADGRVRWFSVSCTATLNRVGEIDGRKLFDSFARHIDAGEAGYPIRVFFHQGEQYRTGQADFVARDENVLVTSGLFDDSAIARAEIAAREKDPAYWGESIGYQPLSEPTKLRVAEGVDISVFTDGVLNEISTLPEEWAASLFTANTDLKEVNRMLEGKVYEAFVKLFGEDEAAAKQWLAEHPEAANRAIAERGLIARTVAPDVPVPAVTEPAAPVALVAPVAPVEPAPVEREIELDEAALAAIAEKIAALPQFAELFKAAGKTTETVETLQGDVATLGRSVSETVQRSKTESKKLEDRVAALERTDADKQAEWRADLPAAAVTRVTYRPREAHADGQAEANMAQKAQAVTGKLHRVAGAG